MATPRVPAASAPVTPSVVATAASAEVAGAAPAAIQRHRFTVGDLESMAEAGVFAAQDERVELIEGEIVDMSPMNPPHAWIVSRLMTRFIKRLGDRPSVRVQCPIRIDRYSQPQPDLAVARGAEDDYAAGHPQPADVLLVIEVADSSLRYDRLTKMPLYAKAGIPEAWLVDVSGQTVTAYTDPGSEGYAQERVCRRGDTLAATAVSDLRLPVADVFGPARLRPKKT